MDKSRFHQIVTETRQGFFTGGRQASGHVSVNIPAELTGLAFLEICLLRARWDLWTTYLRISYILKTAYILASQPDMVSLGLG